MNTQTERAPGVWTVQEVADYLQKSTSWIYKQAVQGLLPVHRIGGNLRFLQREIDEYVIGSWQPPRGHQLTAPRNKSR